MVVKKSCESVIAESFRNIEAMKARLAGTGPDTIFKQTNSLGKGAIYNIDPLDYIKATEEKQNYHKIYGVQQDKVEKLKKALDKGELLDMPSLVYGKDDYFGQEGYHRAYLAYVKGRKTIPVSIEGEPPEWLKAKITPR